ncbi:hypothetical protein KGM_207137 [Danaus plexippus plexippus]|uniref:Uncharacterized protein n=1 Tax=Danaus plexippus plexippus TaxID=278856 RepID=A0A212FM81_DANPL|nr:hypothetical protein KGM_207137 [Danaus plexippus plexippus]
MSVRSFYFVLACAACAHCDDQNTEDIILNKDIKPASLYAANSTINTDGEENTLATKKEAVGTNGDIIYDLSDEEYYAMPRLFDLEEFPGCLATRGVYCLGSFELTATTDHPLFRTMKQYSANWVDNFNHTRLHRGVCLPRSCQQHQTSSLEMWFETCINASTTSSYNLSARLYKLEYCTRGTEYTPLSGNEQAFAAVLAALLAFAIISTVLDLTLSAHVKKGCGWALSWSLRQSWQSLVTPAPATRELDLRSFDGLRVFCMLCVIIEHVCWLGTISYIENTRIFEQLRHEGDVILMTNSTLVVQIFFLMASFLLAHKILEQKNHLPPFSTFFDTMINRIIRVSPSYFMVLWFASSWWWRLGQGPMWTPLVTAEADICRRKWWTHLLYLNNVLIKDDKCLIQTWYLAADMQLYALSLALTLLLRGRRCAVRLLIVLFGVVSATLTVLAYMWKLVPTFVLHNPESVRLQYSGEASFNWLYQSPLGNAPGALAGLLLAHAQRRLPRSGLLEHQLFRWVSVAGAPAALCWAALSPMALGAGPPNRLVAALLAALERPIFLLCVTLALLGAIHGIKSPWRTWLSHSSAALARLSFGALLLHMPLNKALLGSRLTPTQLDRQYAIYGWFGVAVVSYAAALPLALLVELPVQRLYKELTLIFRKKPPSTHNNKIPSLDKTEFCSTEHCSK